MRDISMRGVTVIENKLCGMMMYFTSSRDTILRFIGYFAISDLKELASVA